MIIRQIPSNLTEIEVSDPVGIRGSHFPDFMIIGPQRTGTGWLEQNLRRHPEIFMSTPKEIYFFSHLKLKNHRFYQSSDLNWYVKFFTEPDEEIAKKDKEMLKRYGRHYSPKMRGEATASYAAMEEAAIRTIHLLNPGIKIIMNVRNPIDRAWSHAKKTLAKDLKISIKTVPMEKVTKFFTNAYQVRCGRFSKIITDWRKIIGKENFLIQHFEQIDENPVKLLETACEFLGVDSPKKYFAHRLVKKKVNPTEDKGPPPECRDFLEEFFAEEIKTLREEFGVTFKGQ